LPAARPSQQTEYISVGVPLFLQITKIAMPSRLTLVLLSLLLATPPVIFWLWLVIVPTRSAELCPEKCECKARGYEVRCKVTSLTAVPLIRLTFVRVLRLYGNKITLLEKDSFVTLTELVELNFYKCGLRKIELGAFNGLTKFTVLSIRNNEISEIIPGTSEKKSSLKNLSLNDNRLEHLDSNVFSGLFNIKCVYLGHNKLQYLHPDTFLGSPKLQQLYLSYNPTLRVPTDRIFINSHCLTRLEIAGCNISSVSVETFANVSALQWLDLRNNKLTTININILTALPKLSTLYLDDTPLHCDCQLQEVWRWCEERNIRIAFMIRWRGLYDVGMSVHRSTICATPSELRRKVWWVLNERRCLEGNIEYYGDYNKKNNDIPFPIADIETDTQQHGFFSHFLKQYQIPLYAFPFIFGKLVMSFF
jgi:hypothetical protein